MEFGKGGGGGYTIHLSYRVVVEEVIHPVEEVICTTPKILLSSPVPIGHGDWGTGIGS